MAYAALISLAQTTDLILNPLQYSISAAEKEQITSIREYAIFLISLLDDFPGKANRSEGKIRFLADEGEDLIENFMWNQIHESGRVSRASFEQQLNTVREEFGLITGDMMDDRLGGSPAAAAAAANSSSILTSTGKCDTVFGLDEDLRAIKGRLCGESSKLEIIPILGMGGIGKTTLARFAYDDQLTVEYFYIRAWITISQDFTAQGIISCLRDSIKSFDKRMLGHENEATMREIIYKCLKGRRYLIVMDDVWSTKALDDVRNIFPDDRNGSRIMLTTRLSDVATYAVSDNPVHEMKFMGEDQCWNLLKEKVFANRNCRGFPSELEDIGKEIARSCRGLPLAVVLVAGVLSKVVVTRASWEEIAYNLNSVVGEQLEKILSLSYTHLPHHLRSCFLYMGGFPEDHKVRVSELIKLWVAEGFLKRTTETKSMEEEAEEHLEDLVERSLVLVSSRKSNGKMKSCSLHDLVRDLCIRKAGEVKFHVRRLSVTNVDNLSDTCGSAFRTILYFQQLGASCSGSLDFLERCKLLRVLSVANDTGGLLYSQIFELFHLRYLALPDLVDFPSTIYKLENLHTLIIKPKSRKSIRKFQLEICRMPQLRHLVVYSFYALLYSAHGSTLPLENLQTLSGILNPFFDEKFLEMFPNVKKLGLVFPWSKDDHQLYNLARLHKLEKLKVTMDNFSWVGQNLALPSSLKMLTLYGREFPRKYMTVIGSLPNLEVLKLMNHACGGGTWKTADGEFPQLKFLLIERSTLRHWKTEYGHFPRLKCLILRNCCFLKQVPDGIGEIPSLEMIEVDFTNKLLVDSAKEIQEDRQSNGDDSLQVRIVDCLHESTCIEKTSGKTCYMIGAMQLVIKYDDDPEYCQWKASAESRFPMVAELKRIDILDISVGIKTLILSSNTTIAAYLVFKLAEEYSGLESAHALVRYGRYKEDSGETRKIVHLQQRVDAGHGHQEQNGRYPVWRDDGWMEVELGSFYNDGDGEAEAKLMGMGGQWKSGLIIEGIVFRPKTPFVDLEFEHLSMLSQSQTECYMIGAKELMIVWSETPQYWQWKPCADSRFSEVAELRHVRWLDIRVKTKTQMLSMNATCAAYLVFKLAEECYGLESANAVVRFASNVVAEETSTVVHLQQRANDDDDDEHQEQNGRLPVWRDDGWMEVELGSFYNHDDDDGEAVARLTGIDGRCWKKGLIIEGIEFRPKVEFDPRES